MMLPIRSTDRLHWLIWAHRDKHGRLIADQWCVAQACNGCPINTCEIFPTWAEALSFARHEGEIV